MLNVALAWLRLAQQTEARIDSPPTAPEFEPQDLSLHELTLSPELTS
jgi:hypothetical protein